MISISRERQMLKRQKWLLFIFCFLYQHAKFQFLEIDLQHHKYTKKSANIIWGIAKSRENIVKLEQNQCRRFSTLI